MTEIKDLDMVSERGQRSVENGLKTEAGKASYRIPFWRKEKYS
jgi:hypothetical protein